MKILKISVAVLISLMVFGLVPSIVKADTYGQTTCTGSYGQTVVCGQVKGASTSGKVVYLANTALDTKTTILASAILALGLGAVLVKRKIA